MRVIGKRLLVEQIMTKEVSNIHRLEKAKDENFVSTFKILEIGKECPTDEGVKVGDIPIFSKHVDFHGVNKISQETNKVVLHVIVYYDDLIGLDDPVKETNVLI
jgi:hypothetical protein